MEIVINREIRDYTESIFFGLSMRQFSFSLLAVTVAVVLYFTLDGTLGTSTLSWVCVLGAAPFAAAGFVKYQGMTFEQFVWAWFVSAVLTPRELVFQPTNLYYEAMQPTLENHKKEAMKHHEQYSQPDKQSVSGTL